MRSTDDLRPCRVDGRMDHERRGVEQPVGPAGDDLSFVVDLDQVGGFDQREGEAEGVYPEGRGVDGVAEGDVACYSCELLACMHAYSINA